MDPTLAPIFQEGIFDQFTYKPFIADTNWYATAKRKYDAIYTYKATDDGIVLQKIRTHLQDSLPHPLPTQPNAITIYFPDTRPEPSGLSPYGSTTEHILFDMDPATQIFQLLTLLQICRSPAPDLIPLLTASDTPLWPGTPQRTALSHPLLRELLLIVALRSFVLQGWRLAPGAQDLVKHIAQAGPPVVPQGVRVAHDELAFASEFHRGWVWRDEGIRWEFVPKGLRLRRDVEAALVRNGWRDPARGVRGLEVLGGKKGMQGLEGDERGICDLVEALVHVGYLDNEEKRAEVLVKVARWGAVGAVRFTVGKIERGSITREQECEILPAAAGMKGRADVLKFLLDCGLDPNTVNYKQVPNGKKRNKLALHLAIRLGDVEMVKVLLDAGANMVKDDEWGLPIQSAEGLRDAQDRAAKVAVIEQWLQERGLPRNHADLPVFADEIGSGTARIWGSQAACCGTCGARR
ncbi:hypothetical protein B0H67DRAFT_610948 [Lasiosphaeris hirsuta]|uniref:Ankyrin repeat protein n=1 Tax=Lasiosphaeris hirsuta TaxID=260670 RepID=A0AA40DRK3_9PEZI|nr:hypothetical protein B0H67DRAFT_610948 [Lasiosphaeris hirsuta]